MYVEKTENGKYRFHEYYTKNKKRKKVSVTFDKNNAKTRRMALEEINNKIKNNLTVIADMTLEDLYEKFLEEKKITTKITSYNTIQRRIHSLNRYINPTILLSELDVIEINESLNCASLTLQQQFKMILRFAYKKSYLKDNISDRLYFTKKRKDNMSKLRPDDKKYYEKEELEDIFSVIETKEYLYAYAQLRLLVEFLVLTGLRLGEALALEESDVKNSILSVNKSVTRGILHSPKTPSSIRDIGLNNRCNQIIAESKMLKLRFKIKSPLIFSNSRGNYFQADSLRAMMKKLGLDSRFHKFRHTHASLLAELGISLNAIQRRLGHENDEITKQIYIHVTNKMKKDELDAFTKIDLV